MQVAHHTRTAAAVASATLFLMALAGPVAAHASLLSSSPAEGSGDSISQLTQVTLTIDDDLDATKSQFIVVNENGGTVATGHVTADPKVMQVTGLLLNWGAQEARWTVVAGLAVIAVAAPVLMRRGRRS